MPIYEYACDKCKKTQEIIQKFNDPTPEACPECNSKGSLAKIVSNSAFHLKGGGWYKDLYSSTKTSSTSQADDKSSKVKTENKKSDD